VWKKKSENDVSVPSSNKRRTTTTTTKEMTVCDITLTRADQQQRKMRRMSR